MKERNHKADNVGKILDEGRQNYDRDFSDAWRDFSMSLVCR